MSRSTMGRCDDCGGASHPYAVYVWPGSVRLRDAVCPIHGSALARTTEGKRGKFVRLKWGARSRTPLDVIEDRAWGRR